jgi:hypothetical protein
MMAERLRHAVSLVGRTIQDLTFEPLEPGAYTAELAGWPQAPQYKQQGFFAFVDVPPGEHRLILSGARFQSRSLPLTLPLASPLLTPPGEDELVIVVGSVNPGQSRITFPAVDLPRPIRAGARVLTATVETTLAAGLDAGTVTAARLTDAAGISEGDLVRLVRDASLRLRHGPYSTVPHGLTRIVGRIGEAADPELGLPGVTVRVTHANGESLTVTDVAGASVVTVDLAGTTHVFGFAQDLACRTNGSGDYNLYFADADFLTAVTLEIAGAGFQTRTKTLAVAVNQRTKADFTLPRD